MCRFSEPEIGEWALGMERARRSGLVYAVVYFVVAGTRPYHTLIPGMLMRGKELVGPFGLMGGMIQAQSHTQFLCSLLPLLGSNVASTRFHTS